MGVGDSRSMSSQAADGILLSERMFTSKLHVDPAHVAEAEKDDWAK